VWQLHASQAKSLHDETQSLGVTAHLKEERPQAARNTRIDVQNDGQQQSDAVDNGTETW
jgi:hypothetical protein